MVARPPYICSPRGAGRAVVVEGGLDRVLNDKEGKMVFVRWRFILSGDQELGVVFQKSAGVWMFAA